MAKLAISMLLAGVLLGGCATLPKAPKIAYKTVPVYCLNKDQIPPEKSLPISKITSKTAINDMFKDASASIAILLGENQKLRNLLISCVKPAPSKKKK